MNKISFSNLISCFIVSLTGDLRIILEKTLISCSNLAGFKYLALNPLTTRIMSNISYKTVRLIFKRTYINYVKAISEKYRKFA